MQQGISWSGDLASLRLKSFDESIRPELRARLIVLNEEKEVGYTTTLKIMQIMADKQLVNRNTDSRTHIYESRIEEDATQKQLLKKFVDATFRGSAMKLVMQALGNHEASEDELEKIKELIKKIESGK